MNRARFVFAAALIGIGATAGTALAQATQPPPLVPLMAGKKFTPPVHGAAEIEILQPATKRDGANVVTRIQVKNTSSAPIARLTVDETWYDGVGATGNIVAGGKGFINGLLQPGATDTLVVTTPYNAKMKANQWAFSHANGTVKPKKVAKFDSGDAAKEPAKAPAKK